MTATIKITHEGPGHHDVEIVLGHPTTGAPVGPALRLAAGMSATVHVHGGQGIAVREIEKDASAAGGVGAVGVSVTPHTPSVPDEV